MQLGLAEPSSLQDKYLQYTVSTSISTSITPAVIRSPLLQLTVGPVGPVLTDLTNTIIQPEMIAQPKITISDTTVTPVGTVVTEITFSA